MSTKYSLKNDAGNIFNSIPCERLVNFTKVVGSYYQIKDSYSLDGDSENNHALTKDAVVDWFTSLYNCLPSKSRKDLITILTKSSPLNYRQLYFNLLRDFINDSNCYDVKSLHHFTDYCPAFVSLDSGFRSFLEDFVITEVSVDKFTDKIWDDYFNDWVQYLELPYNDIKKIPVFWMAYSCMFKVAFDNDIQHYYENKSKVKTQKPETPKLK